MGHDFPAECDRAAQILTTLKAHTNFGIPAAIMQGAKGVAIFHVTKAGMLFSIRSGTGLVLARLPDGSWSAPSAIKDTSLGMGHQLGVEVIDLVFVLNTDKAVEAFAKGHNFQVGADISFAVGPLGRNAEGQLNLKALSAVLTYSHSKGLYLGASVNLSSVKERTDVNAEVYGGHNAESILKGGVPKPAFAASLYAALGEVESATEP